MTPGARGRPAVRSPETPSGPARVVVEGTGTGLLVLGHGAGGGPDALDLQAAREAALEVGWRVALVEQPWRVAGRRVAEAPARLDAAWRAVLADLGAAAPLVVGGRSAGARVACRTARDVGADGVLCLAFPLLTPSRAGGQRRSRAAELDLVHVPLLVVQGGRDAFGIPAGAAVVPGADHGFGVRRTDPRPGPTIRRLVGGWLQTLT